MDVPTHVLEYALSMVNWPSTVKFRLVLYVHANRQRDTRSTVLSLASTREETGISPTCAHKHYDELVDAKVLERFDGGGPRGHAYRVSTRFDLWEVPWLGASITLGQSPSRDWILKRNVALAQIDRLLHPRVESKGPAVARPGARLTATPARAGARLWGATDTPGRATDEDLPARPGARLTRGDDASHTITSNSEPLLTHSRRTEGGSKLLAAIEERADADAFGRLQQEIFAIGCDTNVDRAIARIRNAKPGLRLTAYIEIARSALDTPDPEPIEPPAAWVPPDTSDAAPPPANLRDWARQSSADGAPACENDTGGAKP